ncbi:MAG: antibiotic biosynthesis monooxygenase [Lentisphaeria bacterium]|nr:antibiotic biosynthesis monooxygenase [Lentisphaeria bacterium]
MIHVNARAVIKPECMDAYLAILSDIVPKVRQEPGCIQYEPCLDWTADGTRKPVVTMVETWTSKEALDAHLAGPNIADFRKRNAGMRESSTCDILYPALP